MRCFGRGSVWEGDWFWVEVQGLVFIVKEVDTMSWLDSLKVVKVWCSTERLV